VAQLFSLGGSTRFMKIQHIIPLLLLVGCCAVGAQTADTNTVTISFQSYTNGGSRIFVVISFANHGRVPIQWGDIWVETDGSSEHHAPVFNPHLPWIKARLLESGGSEVIAVGTPSEAQMQWRICRDYTSVGSTNIYTTKSKWFTP